MMKQVQFTMPRRALALLCSILFTVCAFAQQITVNGNVKDATGEPVTSATVRVVGQPGGTVTDIDGNFIIKAPQGADIQVAYIGYETTTVKAAPQLSIVLKDNATKSLNEVVVIGYGVVKKSDLTGSVSALKPDNKNKGVVVNPQDALQGKVAGVNITTDGGTPGAGAKIRIRGGSSLNASNDPLIVIDGVPMDNQGVKGLANPLSMINPQDIESFNVLKDASATAIYGSRGSNGVIIITTKKGRAGQKLQISYSGSATVSMKRRTLDVPTGDEYRAFVKDLAAKGQVGQDAVDALGTANTDWQEEIYRTAISHDHNLTLSGSAGKSFSLPWRVSLGYTSQEGIMLTSKFDRATAALNLNPKFFRDHLSINLNAKGMFARNHYPDGAAISNAVRMDPTQPIYDNTSADAANYGGYWQWKDYSGKGAEDPSYPTVISALAPKNPLSIINLKNDRAISRDFIGNAQFDYKVHGFEDLRLNLTMGADIAEGKQTTDVDPASPLGFYYGSHNWESILKRNLTLSSYAQYYHDFNDKYNNHFDVMVGYEWQKFWRSLKSRNFQYYPKTNTVNPGGIFTDSGKDYDGDGVKEPYHYMTENYLVSFFGRANWSLMDRYFVTATVRQDGSSRFREHWQAFPSFAFAWKVKDENEFKTINWLSDLKLRLGWGMTGQQEGIGDYNYFTYYTHNTGPNSFYPLFGDGAIVLPNPTNYNLKWETTTTYNIGLDWGILDQRLTGSVDWYYRKTTDLLNEVDVPAGFATTNRMLANIGSLYNTGVEVSLGYTILDSRNTKDWYWRVDYNFTANKSQITKLTASDNDTHVIPTGGLSSATGTNAQGHAVGHTPRSYYVYQQVYDKDGKPIENLFVDRNADGQITPDDRYFYKSPYAPVTMGLSSRLEYKNWDFGFNLRANIGNYVFNDYAAGDANVNGNAVFSPQKFLANHLTSSIETGWNTLTDKAVISDRWVENGSFLKVDNVTLGYSFNNLFKTGNWGGISGRIYGTASNFLVITKYSGIDPEVFEGIDRGVYPRPMSFIMGLNLTF